MTFAITRDISCLSSYVWTPDSPGLMYMIFTLRNFPAGRSRPTGSRCCSGSRRVWVLVGLGLGLCGMRINGPGGAQTPPTICSNDERALRWMVHTVEAWKMRDGRHRAYRTIHCTFGATMKQPATWLLLIRKKTLQHPTAYRRVVSDSHPDFSPWNRQELYQPPCGAIHQAPFRLSALPPHYRACLAPRGVNKKKTFFSRPETVPRRSPASPGPPRSPCRRRFHLNPMIVFRPPAPSASARLGRSLAGRLPPAWSSR